MLEALLPKSATRVVVYLEPINVRSGVKKPALGCGLGDPSEGFREDLHEFDVREILQPDCVFCGARTSS